MMTLHYADYIVFGLLLLISALVGPYYMWRDRNKPATSESYFVGNRGLHIVPTAASLFASFWSAIALVGIPAELYTGGAKFFMASFGQAIGIIVGALVAVPVVYNLHLISSYEYFELRFRSRLLRKIGTVSNVLASAFYLAVVTYAPCIALEAVSPIPVWASVTATATITMIYTVLGGIKAVVLVDLIQAVVMFAGVIVAIVIGYWKIEGGFSKAMDIARAGGRLDFIDLNPDLTNTYNFWIMVIPPIFANAGIYATSQAAVQRYSALPTVKQASWSVISLAPQIIVLKLLLFFMALAMFAHYDAQGCDPLRGGIITNPNQLTTFYVADILNYPGLVGLWFAALFSGSLSTMSTGYNSVAACIWEDLLKEKLQHKLTPRGVSHVLKLVSLLLGMSTCVIACFFKFISGSIIKLTNSTVSIFGAAVYIAFFCGALMPFVNALGTMIGMICATLLIIFVAGGQMFYRLGNEEIWLPTKTTNCQAMLASLIAAGKWQPTPEQLKQIGNATKAVTTSLMLLTASPAILNATNHAISPNSTMPILPNLTLAQEHFLPEKTGNVAPITASGDGEVPIIVLTFSPNSEDQMTANDSSYYSAIDSKDDEVTVKNETIQQPKWKSLPKPLLYIFSISYFIFPFLSLLAGLTVAVTISLCTGGLEMAKTIHPRYMVVRNCFYKGELVETKVVRRPSKGGKDVPDDNKKVEQDPEQNCQITVVNQANEDDEDDDHYYVNTGRLDNGDKNSRIQNNPVYLRLEDGDSNQLAVELLPLVSTSPSATTDELPIKRP